MCRTTDTDCQKSVKTFTSVDELLALLGVAIKVEPPDGSSAHANELVLHASVTGTVAVGVGAVLKIGRLFKTHSRFAWVLTDVVKDSYDGDLLAIVTCP